MRVAAYFDGRLATPFTLLDRVAAAPGAVG